MKIEVNFCCCVCPKDHVVTIEAPEGWGSHYDGVDVSTAFCPAHIKIAEWTDAQCPGCVGSWTDCSLFKDFAYTHKIRLTDEDLIMIEKGKCPRRTNGFYSFSREEGFQEADMAEQAPTEAGTILAQAIRDYWKRYAYVNK